MEKSKQTQEFQSPRALRIPAKLGELSEACLEKEHSEKDMPFGFGGCAPLKIQVPSTEVENGKPDSKPALPVRFPVPGSVLIQEWEIEPHITDSNFWGIGNRIGNRVSSILFPILP